MSERAVHEPEERAPEEDPLTALLWFHGRIRAALATLVDFVADAERGRTDPVIARALHEFFTGPLLWHDEDEERSLMARLRRTRHPPRLERMLDAVSEAHHALEDLVESEADYLIALARGDEDLDVSRLSTLASELGRFVERHLTVEEQEILPLARLLLSRDELFEVAAEVRERTRQRARRGERA